MRIVLDTNVLLSALGTHGVCETLLDAILDSPRYTVVLSSPILAEFSRQYQAKFGMTAAQAKTAVQFLREHAEIVEPADVSSDACRDRDDLAVLGTLVAGHADFLVTGDRDLLDLGTFGGGTILSPRQCCECLA